MLSREKREKPDILKALEKKSTERASVEDNVNSVESVNRSKACEKMYLHSH